MLTRRSGFTLIELLVVIAIIGILAAMLFPVFARARESARKVQCLSNVKNIAMAMQMYLADYDRFWPSNHDTAFLDQVKDIAGRDSCGTSERLSPYLRVQVILDEYIKNRDVWRCPSAKWQNDAGTIVPAYSGQTYMDWWLINGGFGPTAWQNGYGACENPFPTGWGGNVTDSALQHMTASGRSDLGQRGATQFTFSYTDNGNLHDLATSQMEDPARYVVTGDSSQAYMIGYLAQVAFPDTCSVTGCGLCSEGCCGANWEDCPGSQACGLDWHDKQKFVTDPQFRKAFTRHLGGSNIGFADGHAKWSSADAIINGAAPENKSPDLLGTYSGFPESWRSDCPNGSWSMIW